jgi:peptidoglycan/xylan/chitin deacetylase (PgdA/CDA1 family)
MDHALYPYSALPARPVLRWPGDKPVAVWVVLYLEYWELATPAGEHRAPGVHGHWGHHFPDYRTYSYREYGNRVGIFRVLDCLDRHRVPVTVAANAAALARYPGLVDECVERGWDIVPHGSHATRMITSAMTEEDERAVIDDAIAAVERATGRRPTGWIGQDFNESTRTPRLVAASGLGWIGDWPNDEQPYWMSVDPPLVSIPQQPEWDDVQLLWMRQVPLPRYPEIVADALAQLAADGTRTGRSLCLGIHPWLLGQPHRIRYLDDVLAHLAASRAAWLATGPAIAAHFAATVARGHARETFTNPQRPPQHREPDRA